MLSDLNLQLKKAYFFSEALEGELAFVASQDEKLLFSGSER